MDKLKPKKFRVYIIPQVGKTPAFHVYLYEKTELEAAKQGRKIIDALADYDLFQLKHKVKPDYASAAGLEVLVGDDPVIDDNWEEWESEYGSTIDAYRINAQGCLVRR